VPSAAASLVGALTLGFVYAGACVYEAWHDPASPFGGAIRAAEAILLVTIGAVLLLFLAARAGGGLR
jgi:hypothetical protein